MSYARTLVIYVTIKAHKESRDKKLQFRRIIDFVPAEGLTFRIRDEDRENAMDVCLEGIIYDHTDKEFIVDLQDDTLYDALRESDRIESVVTPQRMDERVEYYKSFGWEIVHG